MAIITGILVFGLTVSTFTGRVYASELESAEASTVASSEFDEATEEDNSNDESRTLTLEERLENVKNSVETMTGLSVSYVNIHIEGISFDDETGESAPEAEEE